MKNSICIMTAAILLVLSAGCSTMRQHKQETGIVGGGVAGGIVGNALSGGTVLGTGIGAVGGAFIGSEIGKNMK